MCDGVRIDELSNAERLLVVSFRLWSLPYANPERSCPDWRVVFRTAGMEEIAESIFDPLLHAIFSSTCRVMEVHQLGCRGISLDEWDFLCCVSLCQNDRANESMNILRRWLMPPGARIAGTQAQKLSDALFSAGWILPERPFNTGPQSLFDESIKRPLVLH